MLYEAMTQETRRLLGIDVGSKTLGLALYTAAAGIVTPLKTIRRGKLQDDLEDLAALITDYGVDALVVGYPLEADGKEGARCQSVRAFVRDLERAVPHALIILHDERYSSAAAEEALLAINSKRKTCRAVSDAVAAQFILQSYLDKL